MPLRENPSESRLSLPPVSESAASPANDIYPGSLRTRHVSLSTQPGEFLRMSPSTPPVPECLTRKPHPGALRVRRVSRGHPRRELPRMHPSPPRVPSGRAERPLPGTLRVRPTPETPTPSDHPGALGEHATCPREMILFFSRIKIHRKAMQL